MGDAVGAVFFQALPDSGSNPVQGFLPIRSTPAALTPLTDADQGFFQTIRIVVKLNPGKPPGADSTPA